jgi:hypothetical protein
MALLLEEHWVRSDPISDWAMERCDEVRLRDLLDAESITFL